MGGEPLINPDLGMFVCEVKKIFPYTDLRIVSNGLLLPQLSVETAKIIRNFGVTIDISQYPPTASKMADIIEYAREYGLKLNISEKKSYFFKSLKNGISTDYEKIYRNCSSKGCHFLRNGRLYFCPAVSLVYENKDFLGLSITEDEVTNHSFDLVKGKEDGWMILQALSYPYQFCRHCAEREWHKWSISKDIKKEDWLVK